jgi:hypothetical protein
MTALAAVCALALVINVSRDLFFAETRDVEVWLGFEVRGAWAMATAPLHWLIFALGAWALYTQRSWAVPAAVAYVLYVAVSHLVWSEVSPNGRGWPIGLAQAVGIGAAGALLWRADRGRRRSPHASAA